ncbi:MAG: hypothetical protein HY710_09855 [Candidatus Latescibacteria bacterium]|nr:hypothetical protein [Candidatus Latescibacterota bacterium]
MMGTSRWTAAVLLVLTFLLGVGVGFFARGPLFFGPRGPGMEDRMRGRLTNRFAEELKLTPDQRTKVDRILEQSGQKMRALRREVIRPRFEAIADSTRMEIEQVLTPDQKVKFRQLTQKMKQPPPPRRGRWFPW